MMTRRGRCCSGSSIDHDCNYGITWEHLKVWPPMVLFPVAKVAGQGGLSHETISTTVEISPCRRYEEPDSPGKFYFEVCEPDEADVWTLYGHVNGEGVQAIGDFTNRDHAEETFFRITGLKFTCSYKADAHLRIMHAGPNLLETLRTASEWIDAASISCNALP